MIIFNADDFGYSINENYLIDTAFKNKIIQSATILPNFVIPKNTYTYQSLGVHLNLVEGKSLTINKTLTDESGYFYNKKTLLMNLLKCKVDLNELRNEVRAQIILLIDSGFNPSHGDSHQSIHSFPVIYKIYFEELKKAGIFKIRNVISKYNFFETNTSILRPLLHFTNSIITVRRFKPISPDNVLVKAPGLGKPNLTFGESLELWEKGLKNFYNKNTVYECPCHLGLSSLEVELYNSTEFLFLLNKYNVDIGNYFDLNKI